MATGGRPFQQTLPVFTDNLIFIAGVVACLMILAIVTPWNTLPRLVPRIGFAALLCGGIALSFVDPFNTVVSPVVSITVISLLYVTTTAYLVASIWRLSADAMHTMLLAAPLGLLFVVLLGIVPERVEAIVEAGLPLLCTTLAAIARHMAMFSSPVVQRLDQTLQSNVSVNICGRPRPFVNNDKHVEASAWDLAAFFIASIALSLPLPFYRLSLGSTWLFGEWVPAFSLALLLALLVVAGNRIVSHRLKQQRHKADFLLSVVLLYLGILITTFSDSGDGSIIAGALVIVGDYLCRAYLYCAGLRLHSANVIRTTFIIQLLMGIGHLLGHILGLAAKVGTAPSAITLAALFVAPLVAGSLIKNPSAASNAVHKDPDDLREDPGTGPSDSLSKIEEGCEMLASTLSHVYALTSRERAVVALSLQGMNAQAIAEHLVISPNTVKSHLDHIYKKTGIHTQESLIELARNTERVAHKATGATRR